MAMLHNYNFKYFWSLLRPFESQALLPALTANSNHTLNRMSFYSFYELKIDISTVSITWWSHSYDRIFLFLMLEVVVQTEL